MFLANVFIVPSTITKQKNSFYTPSQCHFNKRAIKKRFKRHPPPSHNNGFFFYKNKNRTLLSVT